jgi:hypothetical protein
MPVSGSSATPLVGVRDARPQDPLRRPSLADAFRSCLRTWLLTRLVTVGAATGIALAIGASVTRPWREWDGDWFLHIAEHGYSSAGGHAEAPNFYPLYPALLRLGGSALGGREVLAGILMAFPITLAAFALLFILARDLLGEAEAAHRSVVYLALSPYAFFLQALYSEATFLVFAIAAFVAAERKRFLGAGILAGAAMLARPVGIAVLAGLVVLAVRGGGGRAALTRLSVAPVIFCVFPLILVMQGRSPIAFLTNEHGWRKYSVSDPLGAMLAPFQSFYDGAAAAWTGITKIASGTALSPYTIHDVTAFAVLVVFLMLTVAAWRRLGMAYGVYCAASLAIPLVTRPYDAPLLSIQRFALVLFPCFIVLGDLPLGRYTRRAILALSCLGLIGLLYLWIRGGTFVA